MNVGFEIWYSQWGAKSETWWDRLRAHIRTARPATRLWFDTIMPITVMVVLTEGNLPLRNALLLVMVMVLFHWAATILNDVQDAETDCQSIEVLRRTRPIATGVISKRVAVLEVGIIGATSVIVAALVNWWLAAYTLGYAVLIAIHELPPTRTQSRPILSPIAGIVGLVAILIPIGLVVGFGDLRHTWPFMLFLILYLGLGEMLIKDIRDMDNDAAGGKQTTAVHFGAGKATRFAAIANTITALPWLWFVSTYPAALPLPLWLATVVLLSWVAATWFAASRMEQAYSKPLARFLHRGSVATLTLINLLTAAGIVWRS